MSYVVDNKKRGFSNQIVFVRSNVARYIVGLLLLCIGLVFLLPGVFILVAEKPESTTFLMTGFGAAFTGGALLLLFFVQGPKRFIFDNDRAALLVEEANASGKTESVPLPYSEIEGFQLRTKIHSGQKNRSVHYLVDVLKADGAVWTLYSSQNKTKSEDVLRILEAEVNLGRSYGGDPVERRLPGFTISEQGDHTELSWSVRHSFGKFLCFLLFFSGFGLALYSARPRVPAPLFYGVGVFLSIIVVLVIYSQLAALGKKQVVEITKHEVRVFQRGGLFPSESYTIPFSELKAIVFNFSPHQEDAALYFLRHDEFDTFHQLKQGKLEMASFTDMIRVALRTKRIAMQGHSVSEMLYVEQLLQKLIKDRTGHRPA